MESVEIAEESSTPGTATRSILDASPVSVRWIDRIHPAEKLVGWLFISFLVLSFLAFSTGRQFGVESLRLATLYGVLWLAWVSTVFHIQAQHHRSFRFIRNIGPWLAVMLAYNLVRYLIPAIHPARLDPFLRKVEINWGMGQSGWVHALQGHPAWTDFFSAVYLGLFVWMVLYAVHYALLNEKHQQRFMLGFVLIYIGGFLGYMLCPATGPRYAYPEEWTWLSGGFFFAFCNQAISGMGAKLDGALRSLDIFGRAGQYLHRRTHRGQPENFREKPGMKFGDEQTANNLSVRGQN